MQSIKERCKALPRQVGAIQIVEIQTTCRPSLHIVCGRTLSREYRRVMPIFSDESQYLATIVSANARGKTLDIGTGSGVLALHAAQSGCNVTGVDINSRAVRFARMSAELSGLGDKCTFLEGDLFSPIGDASFDSVICNPPFVALPPDYRMFLSADGGPDGLRFVRRVLKDVDAHLAPGGILLMLTMSLGNDREPLVFQPLRDAFKKRKVRIETTHIYESIRAWAEPFFSVFSSVPTYSQWRRFLDRQKLTHLYYMLHIVEPSDRFDHIEQINTTTIQQLEFSGSWAGRLNRFKRWFEEKVKQSGNGDAVVAGEQSDSPSILPILA